MTWFWARKLSSTVQALQDVLLRMQHRDLAEILGPISEKQITDAMHSVEASLLLTPVEPTLSGKEVNEQPREASHCLSA